MRTRHLSSILCLVICITIDMSCAQNKNDLEAKISKLEFDLKKEKAKNNNLSIALAHAEKHKATAYRELDKLRTDMKALGTYPLGESDELLVQAVANRLVLENRNRALENAAYDVLDKVREYLKTALAADPQARLNLESSIRGLDVELGMRQKPQSQLEFGSLQRAKIISIDGQSGMLLLNAGQKQQVRIGMKFRIVRNNSLVAEAIIARVRSDISGALVVKLEDTNNEVRTGDTASIKTIN